MIVVAAQLTDPGTTGELIALSPAVVAFALRGLVPRLPAEVFALLVIVPVALVVGLNGEVYHNWCGRLAEPWTGWRLLDREAPLAVV